MSELIDRDARSVRVWTAPGSHCWSGEAYRRIYERELLLRLPQAHIGFVANLAAGEVVVSVRGDLITPLDASAEDPAAPLAGLVAASLDLADLTAVAGDLDRAATPNLAGCILSAVGGRCSGIDEREPITTLVNTARDVSVRSARAGECLRALRPGGAIELVPDPLVLLGRLTSPAIARSRIEYLRAIDRYPRVDTVVIEVSVDRMGHLAALARDVSGAIARGYRIAVVAMPVDGEAFTTELRQCVERTLAPVHCVEHIDLDDRLAVIATSAAVVPLSPAALAAACAFGRPSLWTEAARWDREEDRTAGLAASAQLRCDDFGSLLETRPASSVADAWCRDVDRHFDRMAAHLSEWLGDGSKSRSAELGRLEHLETAHRIAGRRLAGERLRFAELTEGLLGEIAELKRDRVRRSARETVLREDAASAFAHARHEAARGDLERRRVTRLEAETAELASANAALRKEHRTLADVRSREHAAFNARIDDLSHENAALNARIDDLSHENAALNARIDDLSNENAALTARIRDLLHENAALTAHIRDLLHDRTGHEDTIADLVRQRDQLRAAVDRFARSKSWRYLAPARAVARTLRRWLGIHE